MTRPKHPPSGYNKKRGGVRSAPEASMSDKNPAPYVYAEAVPVSAYAPRQHEPQYGMNHKDYIDSSTRAPAPNPASMSSMSYEDDGTGITPISSSYVPAAPKIKCAPGQHKAAPNLAPMSRVSYEDDGITPVSSSSRISYEDDGITPISSSHVLAAPRKKICAAQPNYYQGSNNAIIPKQAVAPSVNNIIMPSPAVNNITNVVVPQQPTATSNPPPGVSDGGIWGMGAYSGIKTYSIATVISAITCLAFLLPCGLWAFRCPCDKKPMYKLNAKVYDAKGHYVCHSSNISFVPISM